jgi:hypothetical protein
VPVGQTKLGLALRLGRELRYRELPELIGRTITLRSLDDARPALCGLVAPLLGPDAHWEPSSFFDGALAKYGLIDTEFAAPTALLDHPTTERGIPVLRRMGFAPRRGERWDDLPEVEDPYCLEELARDLDQCRLKLFLQDGAPHDSRMTRVADAMQREVPLLLPDSYFPCEQRVIDACVTNSSFIWFNAHFYL